MSKATILFWLSLVIWLFGMGVCFIFGNKGITTRGMTDFQLTVLLFAVGLVWFPLVCAISDIYDEKEKKNV